MKKTLLFSLWLTILTLFSTSVFGQELLERTVGFESSEGFRAANIYNNTTPILTGATNKQWSTYYGTPTTSDKIKGDQSLQMRWYNSAPSNLGYTETAFEIDNLSKVVFKANSTNSFKVKVQYSVNGTNEWIGDKEYDLGNNTQDYTYELLTANLNKVKIRFNLVKGTGTATSRVTIDDVRFYVLTSTEPTFTQPTALASFSHYVDRGPSAVQSFVLKGNNLDATPVTLAAANGFEISTNQTEGFVEVLTLEAESTLNQTIYVRYNGDAVGVQTSTLAVTGGGATLSIPVQGEVKALPDAPSINAVQDLSAVYNQQYSHQIQFTGSNVTLALTAGALPTGLSLNETSGLISGQSTEIGEFLFDITATDSFGQSAVGSFVINTTRANQTFVNLVDRNVVIGDEAILLPLTTEQNTAITYLSSDDAVVRVEDNQLLIVSSGTVEITATAPETVFYNTAETTFTVTVAKKNYADLGLVNLTKTIGEVVELPATTTEGEAIVYTSPNEEIATVEANVLTLVGAGNTTITAVVAETSIYNALTTTFNVVVNKRNQTIVGLSNLTNNIGDVVVLPVATTEGEVIVYTSANENIVTVEANVLTFVGIGRTSITAKALETPVFTAVQESFTIVSKDPNAVAYNGQGIFKKITSVEDVTDGYYVVANETGAFLMTNNLTSNYLVHATSGADNNLIVNPDINNVWVINTDGNAKTIYNEVIEKYVGWIDGITSNGNVVSLSDVVDDKYKWKFTYTANKFNVNNVATPARQLSYNSGSPRFAAYGNTNQQELWLFKLVVNTTWDGVSWSNGLPTADLDAIIVGDLELTENVSAKSITVENGGSLTVKSGSTLTVKNAVINNATADKFVIEAGANLVQVNPLALNRGDVTILQNSKEMYRNDMSQWSSPVVGQQIRSFSPETLFNRFWTYNEATTQYVPNLTSDTDQSTFEVGKGYAIRVKNTLAVDATTVHDGAFKGVLNNGNITVNVTKDQHGFNLVGNPYSSNIRLDGENGFFAQNPNVSQIFIWTPHFRNGTENYGNNYITVTKTDVTGPVELQELNTIAAGQGFFVQVIESGTIEFNNSMRVGGDVSFFRTEAADKFALSLIKDQAKVNTIALGYFNHATEDVDHQMDAKSVETGDVKIYSLIGDNAFSIQARNFNINDRVRLGYKANQAGELTIAMERNSGIFAEQSIFLLDKLLDVTHDLTQSDYRFNTDLGQFDNRFEVIYVGRSLSTTELSNSQIKVYQNNNKTVVESTEAIQSVMVYDTSGRKVSENKNIYSNKTELKLSKGVYYLLISLDDQTLVSEKVLIK